MAETVGQIVYEVAFDTKQVIDGRRVIDRELDLSARAFNKITQAISIYAAALATVKSAQAADDVRLLGARVQVAAGSIERGAAALAELERISARTQTRISENAAVFSRLNSSIVQMGGTQQDTLRLTELLAMGIKVSGASAQEASAAMLQFGQALASGTLQGDELRSLLENAPYLMQRLADGIGVPVGQLKKLGEEGKLTADVVTQALGKAAAQIEADFKKLPQTFEAALGGAEDAAKRANEAFDTLTGTSAALAGVAKGTGTVLDQLAQYFRDATTEADKLGRNGTVRTWAETTTVVLTYVIDVVDVVTRQVRGFGVVLLGTAQVAQAAARGGLSEAAKQIGEIGDKLRALATTKTAGAAIRETLAQARVEDRGFTPGRGFGPMKGGGGTGGKKDTFDDAKYLAKLRADVAEEADKIAIIEEEALRENADRRKKGLIDQKTADEAELLIRQAAFNDRLALAERNRQRIEEEGKKDAEQAARLAQEQAQGRKLAEDAIVGGDPVQQVILEAKRKSDALLEAAQRDQASAQLYAEARVALEQQTAQRIQEIVQQRATAQAAANSAMLQAYSGLFGNLADLSKGFAGEQSGIYRAMFAASKAFAIADAIIKIQQGIANSLSLPFPANLAAAAATASQAVGIVSTIRGTNYGGARQYGGETAAGKLYRINETGRPEMFTAANGAQYMLPTQRGSVTSASDLAAGGGVAWTINIHEAPPGTTASVNSNARIIDIAVGRAVDTVAGQIRENTGPVFSAMRAATNVQGKL